MFLDSLQGVSYPVSHCPALVLSPFGPGRPFHTVRHSKGTANSVYLRHCKPKSRPVTSLKDFFTALKLGEPCCIVSIYSHSLCGVLGDVLEVNCVS